MRHTTLEKSIRAGSMSVKRTNNLNIVKLCKYSNAQRFKKKHVVENKQLEQTNKQLVDFL